MERNIKGKKPGHGPSTRGAGRFCAAHKIKYSINLHADEIIQAKLFYKQANNLLISSLTSILPSDSL